MSRLVGRLAGSLGALALLTLLPVPAYAWSWSGGSSSGGWSSGGWSTPTTTTGGWSSGGGYTSSNYTSGGSSGGWDPSLYGMSSGNSFVGGYTIGGVSIPTASIIGTSTGYVPPGSSTTGFSFGNAYGNSQTGIHSSGTSWTPASGTSDPLTQTIGTSTPGFQPTGNGQYTYNGCAAQGGITAYNVATGKSYCQTGTFVNGQYIPPQCPAGEAQIDNDGVCQGTGSDSPGIYPQWTFSACVNGQQTEYTHNVQTDAVVSQSTVSCVANPAPTSNPPTGGSSTPIYTPPPTYTPPTYTPPPVVTTSTQTVVGTFTFAACMPNPEETTYNGQPIQPPQNDQWVTAGNAPPNTLLPGPGWAIDVAPQTLVTTTCTG